MAVYTDAHTGYRGLAVDFQHEFVDHAERYVLSYVHTNGLENFWSLFKRCVHGTYVSVDAPHLQRYVDEEVFRFNERDLNDGQRFDTVLPGVVGKRLTYKTLIGAPTPENLISSGAANGGGLPN